MKKSFKTIMALTAALAISMSGMYITTADEEPTPPPPTTQSVVVEDKGSDGKFDEEPQIPVTMSTDHLLSVTIEFGDMLMSYDFKNTSANNNYGWGDSFNGKNNKLTITNNSTCPVNTITELKIDTETYPFLEEFDFKCIYHDDEEHHVYRDTKLIGVLKYTGHPDMYHISRVYSLEPTNKTPTDMANMHNYQFNNAKIGTITITLNPQWQTL